MGGYGLEIIRQDECAVCFESSLGTAEVAARGQDGGTQVDVLAREYEAQAREFMGSIR